MPLNAQLLGTSTEEMTFEADARWLMAFAASLSPLDNAETQFLEVPEGGAHVYSECARIWNPIHTDRDHVLDAHASDHIRE